MLKIAFQLGVIHIRRYIIEGAWSIPYSVVPNFLGLFNLTPQYPTLPSDIARSWCWTFGPSLSDRWLLLLDLPLQGGPLLGQMAPLTGCQMDHRVNASSSYQPQRHQSSTHPQISLSQRLGLQTLLQSPGFMVSFLMKKNQTLCSDVIYGWPLIS